MWTLVINWNNPHPAIGPIVDLIIKKRPWLEDVSAFSSMTSDVLVTRSNTFFGRIYHFGPRWDPAGRGDDGQAARSACVMMCYELKYEFRAEARKNAELWKFLDEEAPGDSCFYHKNRVNFHAFMSESGVTARDHPEEECDTDDEVIYAQELEDSRKKRERLESTYHHNKVKRHCA